MPRIGLVVAFFLLLSGCASHSALTIQPHSQLAIEVPSDMFSSIKVRDGELLFLTNNQIIGFVKSDEIPKAVRSEKAADTALTLFESVSEGSQKPSWIDHVPEAQVFGVVQGDFRTIFIVPNGSEQFLVTFQGPSESSRAIRINGAKVFN
ncbi:hypothetical protein EHN06_01205 [Marinobacter sp. NP-4(2019)]|uniref:hypothetical protein n=1 Tax=Marinobacter sp. NP-4(2019) TaxID=2488665 RepID=UPI000FC3D735|nr:hypothetical protein [Marinobacter sp. NP-4(2019)]AZT82272.1 hypothetical protein EHN06_01205 [Marinobacter sp. NP-4(2019)]